MKVDVKLDEDEIKQAIADYIDKKAGVIIDAEQVIVEVKSKQNYRSEWEHAAIRAEFTSVERK
jgi:tetrahydromethanopterin S-methyltransferase subunit A